MEGDLRIFRICDDVEIRNDLALFMKNESASLSGGGLDGHGSRVNYFLTSARFDSSFALTGSPDVQDTDLRKILQLLPFYRRYGTQLPGKPADAGIFGKPQQVQIQLSGRARWQSGTGPLFGRFPSQLPRNACRM